MKKYKAKLMRFIGALKKFVKKHKAASIALAGCFCIVFIILVSPKTIDYGNGWRHQVGNFGKCDVNFSGCTGKATHRYIKFLVGEKYCDVCWEYYGQDFFNRLSENEDNKEHTEVVCRRSGCGKPAKHSEWDRRYCAEHLQGEKYCRYPGCSELIPINGFDDYCWKH